MNKKILFVIATIILLGAAYAAYEFWQGNQPKPEIVQAKIIPQSLPAPSASACTCRKPGGRNTPSPHHHNLPYRS